jgi:hypothetical protein
MNEDEDVDVINFDSKTKYRMSNKKITLYSLFLFCFGFLLGHTN